MGGQQSGEQTQRRPWRHASHVQFVVKDSGHCNEDKVAPTYVILVLQKDPSEGS